MKATKIQVIISKKPTFESPRVTMTFRFNDMKSARFFIEKWNYENRIIDIL